VTTTPLRRPRLNLGIGPQVTVVVLVVVLAGAMAIQPTRQLLAQRTRISEMSEELRRIETANAQLEAHIARLNDPDYIETRARSELGLVRPGETTFVVMPPTRRAARRKERGRERAPATRPSPPGFVERLLDFIGVP
jgi:cell division protein FtsB